MQSGTDLQLLLSPAPSLCAQWHRPAAPVAPYLPPPCVQEGTDLFLIPAIDMINHANDPARRNSSLHRLSTSMTVQLEGQQGEITFTGFFTMKAGVARTPCPCLSPRHGPLPVTTPRTLPATTPRTHACLPLATTSSLGKGKQFESMLKTPCPYSPIPSFC